MSDVTVTRCAVVNNPPMLAFVDLEFFGCVAVKCKLMERKNDGEMWLALPSAKKSDGDWETFVYINDDALAEDALDAAIAEYESAPKPDSSTRSRRRSNSSRSAGAGQGRRRSVRTSSRRREQ